jgi:hypothetical protein
MKDYLVIVIDSSQIQILLVQQDKKEQRVHEIVRKYISVTEKAPSTHLEHLMIESLSAALQKVQPHASKISKIHIVLSSPWIVSKTKTSNITFPKPFLVDQPYIDSIVENERTAFKKIFPFDVEFVEQKVFDIKVNGYHAKLKKKVPAISLSVTSAMSAMSKKIVQKIVSTVDHYFHNDHISFHSSSILTFVGMQHFAPHIESGVFIHVHGECTDVTLFKQGTPTHFASINQGYHSVVTSLAKSLRVSNIVADSKISLLESGEISAEVEKRVVPLIHKKLDEWQKTVTDLILDVEDTETIPLNIIVDNYEHTDLFLNTLKEAYAASNVTNIPDEMANLYITGIELVEFHN